MHSPDRAWEATAELRLTPTPSSRAPDDPSLDAAPKLAFDQVYAQHYRFVWRVLRARGLPAATVDDAVQDVFVVVHRRLPDFDGRNSIRTWLFRITSWVVAHERRRFRTQPGHEPIDDVTISDAGPGPFEMAARSEAIRTLERMLTRMDEEKRIVFVLMDIEEMKAGEVADLLSVNVNTVYSRLRLAREQLRRLREEDAGRERSEP